MSKGQQHHTGSAPAVSHAAFAPHPQQPQHLQQQQQQMMMSHASSFPRTFPSSSSYSARPSPAATAIQRSPATTAWQGAAPSRVTAIQGRRGFQGQGGWRRGDGGRYQIWRPGYGWAFLSGLTVAELLALGWQYDDLCYTFGPPYCQYSYPAYPPPPPPPPPPFSYGYYPSAYPTYSYPYAPGF